MNIGTGLVITVTLCLVIFKPYPLADPGGRRGAPPPTGSISFVFTYVFTEKCTHQRLAPPNGSAPPPPQREILDPPLDYHHKAVHSEPIKQLTKGSLHYSNK